MGGRLGGLFSARPIVWFAHKESSYDVVTANTATGNTRHITRLVRMPAFSGLRQLVLSTEETALFIDRLDDEMLVLLS